MYQIKIVPKKVNGVYENNIFEPVTDDLCSLCQCSLAYGYVLFKDHKFCSIECVNEVD